MIKTSLRMFVERVLDAKLMTDDDVRLLQRDILPNGVINADEADVLIALDRAVPQTTARWSDYLAATITDFVVWTSRPTGYVDEATARWLVGSLAANSGPTPNAVRTAFDVAREAEQAHEALTLFLLAAAPAERTVSRSIADRIA